MVGPASERAASFARLLPAHGWQPFIVTVRGGLFHSDARNVPPEARTWRTTSAEPSRLLGSLRRPTTGENGKVVVREALSGGRVGRLRHLVRTYLYMPDAQVLWVPFAIAAMERAVDAAEQPVVLLSSAVPFSAHLAALVVARRKRIPWVAEFRDPWAREGDEVRRRPALRKALEHRLERWITRSASAVLVTSDATRADMLAAYPGLAPEDIWVVRNGFPPFDERGKPPGPDEPLQLLHAGTVPGETDVGPLLRGVKQVADRHPGRIVLKLIGPPGPWEAARHQEFGFTQMVGLVSPGEARAAMTSSSANIVLVPSVQRNQHVAAKLMEYLGAGRPIVGVVSNESEMAQLGHDYGDMRLVDPYTEADVAEAVEKLLAEHEAGKLQAESHGRRTLDELSRSTQIEQLAGRLNDLRQLNGR
jgi:glycosyltransferase involved in cell wall biosynthesis